MKKRKCANPACRRLFEPNPKNRNQRYCSRKECQKARKAKWQREKMASDEEYRKNQADSQARWAAKKEGYWKRYRASHPEYEDRNREKQKERDRTRRSRDGPKSDASISGDLAKMDALNPENEIITGTYRLIPVQGDTLAKMDAITVELRTISGGRVQT